MGTINITKCAGLQLAGNEFGLPEGSLVKADNVVLFEKDVIEPRPGITAWYQKTVASAYAADLFCYNDTLLVRDGTAGTIYETAGLTALSGTYTSPDSALCRIRGVEANQNFYFTSSAGVYRLDSTTGTPALAGGKKVLGFRTAATTGSSGFLADGYKVAYRAVIGFKDANGNLHLGPPSGRVFVTASGSSANTTLSIYIPTGLSTSYYYRLYRTEQIEATLDPGDEMNLVYERYFDATESGTNYYTTAITDSTTDEFRGTPLYTNPNSGDGILQSNEPPPFAKDMTWWNNRMWYANTKQPYRYYLDMIGTSGLDADGMDLTGPATVNLTFSNAGPTDTAGTVDVETSTSTLTIIIANTDLNDTVTLNGLVFTAKNAENTALREFNISGTATAAATSFVACVTATAALTGVVVATPNVGVVTIVAQIGYNNIAISSSDSDGLAISQATISGSTASQIETAAKELVKAINSYVISAARQSTYRAHYISGPDDLPGKIMIETVSLAATQFSVAIDSPIRADFNPDTTVSAGQTSDNETVPNRIYYSKLNQPEAVPLLNYFDVGSKNKPILRIIPLRDKLFVFKEDEGIYVVSGANDFRVDLLDDTVSVVAPETPAVVNNQIYFLARQGVCAASEGGVAVVSKPISPELLSTASTFRGTNRPSPFGAGWETKNLYCLWINIGSLASGSSYSYVYNTSQNVWTKWRVQDSPTARPVFCAMVNKYNDFMWYGVSNSGTIQIGRQVVNAPASAIDYFGETTPTLLSNCSNVTDLGNGISSATLTFSSAHGLNSTVDGGDVLYLGGYFLRVIAYTSTTVVTVAGPAAFTATAITAATGTIYRRVICDMQWAALTFGDIGSQKLFREVKVYMKDHRLYKARLRFQTEMASDTASDYITNAVPMNLDLEPYDFSATPSPELHDGRIAEHSRVLVPANKARAALLRVGFYLAEALVSFQIVGLSVTADVTSDRTRG